MQGHRVVFREPEYVKIEPFDVEDPGPDGILVRTNISLISPGTEGTFLRALPNTLQHGADVPRILEHRHRAGGWGEHDGRFAGRSCGYK
mgnify:CR=1 FL=1